MLRKISIISLLLMFTMSSNAQVVHYEDSICYGMSYNKNGFHVEYPPVGIYCDTIFNGTSYHSSLKLKVIERLDAQDFDIYGMEEPCVETNQTYTLYSSKHNLIEEYARWNIVGKARYEVDNNRLTISFLDTFPCVIMCEYKSPCGPLSIEKIIKPKQKAISYITDSICVGQIYNKEGFYLGKIAKPGHYTYTIANEDACGGYHTLDLYVMPEANLEIKGDDIVCLGETTTLHAITDKTQIKGDSCPPNNIRIGDIICEGGIIIHPEQYDPALFTAIGVVFYVDSTGEHGKAISVSESGKLAWKISNDLSYGLTYYQTIRDASYALDGKTATKEIMSVAGIGLPRNSWPAYAYAYNHNGILPSLGEMNILMSMLPEIENSLVIAGASPLQGTYWTSTCQNIRFVWTIKDDGFIEPLVNNVVQAKARLLIEF